MSISSRLATRYVIALTVVLALVLMAAYFAMKNLLVSEASLETQAVLSKVVQSLEEPEQGKGESNHIDLEDPDLSETTSRNIVWIQITGPDGSPVQRSQSLGNNALPQDYLGPPAERQVLVTHVIMAGSKLPGGSSIQVARVLTQEDRFLSGLLKVLALLGLAGAGLVGLGSWKFARTALRPVDTLTQAMLRISITDLNQRVAVPGSKDELHKLAQAFNLVLERVEAGFQKQREFTAAVSHDLRTPLTVITSYAELLDRWGKNDPAMVEESVGAILRSAGFMERLLNDLLLLSRLEAEVALQPTEISLDEILAEVVADAQALADRIEVILETVPGVKIKGDADYLRRAIWVLVDNAVKYNRPGGKVIVSLERNKNKVIIHVADTGPGIDANEIAKLFDHFYRSDPTREQDQGFGLGLCLAKDIAEAHGGQIDVKSELGKGSIFSLILPLHAY